MLSAAFGKLYSGYQYTKSWIPGLNHAQILGLPAEQTVSKVRKLFDIVDKLKTIEEISKEHSHDMAGQKLLERGAGESDMKESEYDLKEFEILLDSCPLNEDLSDIADDSGYNVLQYCIIRNQISGVHIILQRCWDLNNAGCSKPLHLASKLGYRQIVEDLLHAGAKADIQSSVCYPDSHTPANCGSLPVPFTGYFQKRPKCLGSCDPMLPVYYALENDHLEVLQILLRAAVTTGTALPYKMQDLFNMACKFGAYRCINFFLESLGHYSSLAGAVSDDTPPSTQHGYMYSILHYFSDQNNIDVNFRDGEGHCPLFYSLPYGEKCMKLLVENSANVHVKTKKSETALHVLFRRNYSPFELAGCLRLLLGNGLEEDASAIDSLGNTALHYAISHVNHRVNSVIQSDILCYEGEDLEDVSMDNQWAYQQQVMETLELLLQHNCDLKIRNKAGNTAFQKLIQSLYNYFSAAPSAEQRHWRQGYLVTMKAYNRAVDTLLKYGAMVNECNPAGLSPLRIMLQTLLNIDQDHLPQYADGFLECLGVLCKHGADTNFVVGHSGGLCVSMLTALGESCICYTAPGYTVEMKKDNAMFVNKVLNLLLSYGLNPNYSSRRRRPYLQGGNGNALVEFVQLTRCVTSVYDLRYIFMWVKTLLQRGADPDIEPYPADPTIIHCQSSIFLRHNKTQAVNHYMHQIKDLSALLGDHYILKLLLLFYSSMDHNIVYQSLNMAKSKFDNQKCERFYHILNRLSSQPRSLKQNARIAVYKALDRKLVGRVEKLDIPFILKEYLLEIEP
jgi:ankyrin repeat protein